MRWALIVVIGVLAGFAAPAKASLLAYEGFNYPAGALAGQSGGGSFGFTGAWYPSRPPIGQGWTVAALGLNDPTGLLATSGGSSTNSNNQSTVTGITRGLAEALGQDGTTRYLSFLGRFEYDSIQDPNVLDYNGITLDSGEPGYTLFAGRMPSLLNAWGVLARQPVAPLVQSGEGVPLDPDRPVLVVVRGEFRAGSSTFALFLNPAPGGQEAPAPLATFDWHGGLITTLTLEGDYRFTIDEIRIGETFADVAPVPEPNAAIILGYAAAVMFSRRFRVN